MRDLLGGFFSKLDAWAISSLGEKYNPFTRLGALAITNLLIAIVTGVSLLPFYDVSVHSAYDSVNQMLTAGRFTSGLIHGVHRYSSDAAVFFALLHLLRVIAIKGYDRPRALSWFTGVLALGFIWAIGWLGYWLVWDQAGFLVAQFTGRLMDSLPFGTPISRGLLLDSSVNNQVFFVVFFVHMLLPLAFFILLWVHIYRVNRPQFVVARRYIAILAVALTMLAMVFPAQIDAKAAPLTLANRVEGDYFYLFALRLLSGISTWGIWALFAGSFGFLAFYPWMFMRKNAEPSSVTPSKCIACMQCINDCPHQAIELKPRDDDKPFNGVAWVNADKCVSCGVCNGACDTFANNLPFLATKDVHAKIDAWSPAKGNGNGERLWLLFVCRDIIGSELPYDSKDGRVEGLPEYRVIAVPCAGHVNPHSVKRALAGGFEGVVVAASLAGGCQYREGDKIAEERLTGERKPTGSLRPEERPRILFTRYGKRDFASLVKDARKFALKEGA